MANTDIVRTMFPAYRAKDRRTAVGLLADDFVFTGPRDDHLAKTAFMQRCFPTADRLISQEILELAAVSDDVSSSCTSTS